MQVNKQADLNAAAQLICEFEPTLSARSVKQELAKMPSPPFAEIANRIAMDAATAAANVRPEIASEVAVNEARRETLKLRQFMNELSDKLSPEQIVSIGQSLRQVLPAHYFDSINAGSAGEKPSVTPNPKKVDQNSPKISRRPKNRLGGPRIK